MEAITIKKDQLPVHAASEQDPNAAVETTKATRLDAGLRSLDHSNLGTHTFFMIFLPILFWCGYTNIGRG
ncbi:MAG: hypothetical protein Q9193_005520 [Seirophora villosa]